MNIKTHVKKIVGLSLKKYTDTYLKAAHNRIDNIVAQAGNDNSEIVDARIDIAGVKHTTLNNRISAEVKNSNIITQPVEGTFITIDSLPGWVKHVEILGNTVQNSSNLADIKSVGDKVEGQDVYEIPLLCVGKNLLSGFKVGGLVLSNGTEYDASDRIRTDFIKIVNSSRIYLSIDGLKPPIGTYIFEYDSNKAFIKQTGGYDITLSSTTKYIRTVVVSTNLSIKVQLEYNSSPTPYEAYKSHELTILSPTQLEKVGTVADRIVEKDGVWGIEKNNFNLVLNGNENWTAGSATLENTVSFKTPIANSLNGKMLISTYAKAITSGISNTDEPLVLILDGYLYIRCLKTVANGVLDWANYVKANNFSIKYPTTTPTFIPLPHDQQILLRTFANKTNISSLCEIAPTIKGDVAKSLGGVVNVHTQEIDNIHQELERVKKLEESTVSTVSNNGKDFTVVEATNNGYFEDVVLNGRTLVNKQKSKIQRVPNFATMTLADNSLAETYSLDTEVGKTYTIIKPPSNRFMVAGCDNTDIGSSITKILDTPTGFDSTLTYTIKVVATSSIMVIYVANPISNINLMVLEGDHTQAPPNGYFEGLKSVGEDSNEIVVSSVDTKGNLLNFKPYVTSTSGGSEYFDLKLKPIVTTLYYKGWLSDGSIINNGNVDASFRDVNKKIIKTVLVSPDTVTLTSDEASRVCYFSIYSTSAFSGKEISSFYVAYNKFDKYVEHKTDKKRILFLDTADNTWKKPTLDGKWENGKFVWGDEFLKHYDGKYYFHKRTEKVAYVAGDESKTDRITDMTTTVKKLTTEKVYECTNLDLITYPNETNLTVKSGILTPNMTVKYHGVINNVVNILQKKVSLLESNYSNMFKMVLSGDMYTLANCLYPEDFIDDTNDVVTLPEEI